MDDSRDESGKIQNKLIFVPQHRDMLKQCVCGFFGVGGSCQKDTGVSVKEFPLSKSGQFEIKINNDGN